MTLIKGIEPLRGRIPFSYLCKQGTTVAVSHFERMNAGGHASPHLLRTASSSLFFEKLDVSKPFFDLAKDDRNLLGVVFRYTGEPEHPLSCLGRGTAEIRRRSTQVFCDAIAEEKLPHDLRELLPVALWALQMGLLVMFLYDPSKNQRRTRLMIEGALDLTLKLLGVAKLAILKPIRTKILVLLREADLLP